LCAATPHTIKKRTPPEFLDGYKQDFGWFLLEEEIMEFDPCQTWYHGSPRRLSILRSGSTITQKRELARVFSHKPTVVSITDEGEIKHNGASPGYLYVIAEEVFPKDVIPHPYSTMEPEDEWLTTRDLVLHLLSPTEVVPAEQLTDEELARLLQQSSRNGK
jgi:hypothetical protein